MQSGETKEDIIKKLKEYNRSLHGYTQMEREYIKEAEDTRYLYGFQIPNARIPDTLEELLKKQNNFKGLLPKGHEKLCEYLTHIQEYTCNTRLIRMDVRSSLLSNYTDRIVQAIGAFYIFYGAGLSIQKLIYGEYNDVISYRNMAPVIAVEIIRQNDEVIGYCRDVLTSENNVGFLTRDLIIAIEQSKNKELQDLLTNMLLAAKLQEGLRQSILETVDEYQLDYFYRMIDVIYEEKLLRYSSVQRSIQTWIGLGYDEVEQRIIEQILGIIHEFIHDEDKNKSALTDENPLKVYIALYCIGIKNMENAINEAVTLLQRKEQHIIAAALIYLQQTQHFPFWEYKSMLENYSDNSWITALYLSECVRCEVKGMSFSKEECHELFDLVYPYLSKLKAKQTYSSKGFEWFSIIIYKESIVNFLSQLLIKAPDTERIELLLPSVSILWTKALEEFLKGCFSYVSLPVKKKFMIKEIISQQEALSSFVTDELKKIKLEEADILALEGRLKTKKAYARAAIIEVLSKQQKESVKEIFKRLNNSQDKLIKESALELQQLVPAYFDNAPKPEVKILGREDGFGLYERFQRCDMPYQSFLQIQKKGVLIKKETVDLSFLEAWDKQKIYDYFTLWNGRIEEHAKDEYQRFGMSYLVGDERLLMLDYQLDSLDAIPFGSVWREYFEKDKLSEQVIFQLKFIVDGVGYDYDRLFTRDIKLTYLTSDETKKWKYYDHISKIIEYYFYECDRDNIFSKPTAQTIELFLKYTKENSYRRKDSWDRNCVHSLADMDVFRALENALHLDSIEDEEFKQYFPMIYDCYLHFNLDCDASVTDKMNISPVTAARACRLGILPQTVLMEMILDTHLEKNDNMPYYYSGRNDMLSEAFGAAYFENRGVYGRPHLKLPEENAQVVDYLRQTLDKISEALIHMETARLNSESSITDYVKRLYVICGMKYLLTILKVLEGEEIKRSSYGSDRQTVFANLIRRCYPLPSDSAKELEAAGIPEKRLVEVAMMAPQWIDLVNEVLDWNGFKEACYYFIAHMKQGDPEHKKAEIAHYTEIDPEDLSDGAFDIDWCRDIYGKLGEKRIKTLYDASKLLCENNFHTRARKYMDACMGKKNKETFYKQASEKRNKDALNAYCIAPIEDDADLLERYLYVQQFLKESKKFGSQRQASEKRSCEIALKNLARNAGFDSVDRMVWKLESSVTDEYSDVFTPQQIDDIQISIAVDANGQNDICVYKNGRKLKSVPAKYKKDERVLRIKEAHQMLKQQYQRTRSMLEKAMMERTEYGLSEIESMSKHMVAGQLVRNLVMICNDSIGFYRDGYLEMGDKKTKCSGTIRVAHAFDLYEHQVLKEIHQYLFDNRIVQPFKQVFRELYLKLPEELDLEYTKRYTGYQIQTKQAAGALKKCGWNASYEYGLEKVSYKYDAVAQLFADADWFSPSDIEAPAIDYVEFSKRRSSEPLLIRDVDDVWFSETMRDVDLAVSLAFIGGVDPVTSTSTVELRRAVIECTCRLMKLTNVRVEGNFAHIEGHYNDYSVHLGSAVVHQKAGSTIHMIPVWSGQRGKVYLPFMDEDPMTAQIVSKVIMLAEDTSIKDPSILAQISKK